MTSRTMFHSGVVAAGALAAIAFAASAAQAGSDRPHHPNPGMQRMHELHMQGNAGMQRMHELHMDRRQDMHPMDVDRRGR
jgi:Spy/CpxP family protein refolding chaperone